jgi:hypothetical protein
MYREMLTDPEAASDFVGATHSAAPLNTAADACWFAASYSGAAPVAFVHEK